MIISIPDKFFPKKDINDGNNNSNNNNSSSSPKKAQAIFDGNPNNNSSMRVACMMVRMVRRYLPHVLGVMVVLLTVMLLAPSPTCITSDGVVADTVMSNNIMQAHDTSGHQYTRAEPLLFIGGMPRSGTTLMRAMLDAHGAVRCGEETRVVPRILQMRQQWKRSAKESMRLKEAGVTDKVLDEAISSFILQVVVNHGVPSSRLCNKDPFTLKSAGYLSQLFPNAKFIFMIRDGRATVHSIISRKVTITGFDLTSYKQCLQRWNNAVQTMNQQCEELGPQRCLPVHYEELVLHPRSTMEAVLDFFELPWDENVMHHEEHINKPGGVSLSKVERSSDQVVKPINLDGLSKWVGQIPEDVVNDMANIAPMLATLGYDPHSNPPNYGKADGVVSNNTRKIQRDSYYWQSRAQQLLAEGKAGR